MPVPVALKYAQRVEPSFGGEEGPDGGVAGDNLVTAGKAVIGEVVTAPAL